MTALTTRDKWLAAALPAMVILLVGWFVFLRPANRDLALLRQRVENQGPLANRQAQVARAQAERADLETTLATLRKPPENESAAFDRNAALQQVSQLCATHGLSLNGTSVELGGRLPTPLQTATAGLAKAGATQPQVWRVELSGTYPGVVKLLEGLQKAQPLIIPLNVTMTVDKNERRPATWVLTLWL